MSKIAMTQGSSMQRAISILNKIDIKGVTKQKLEEYTMIEAYSNCREQGLCIDAMNLQQTYKSMKIVWSESRNSDRIFVCWGPSKEFDRANVPSEKLYRQNSASFDTEREAAKFISEVLTGFMLAKGLRGLSTI